MSGHTPTPWALDDGGQWSGDPNEPPCQARPASIIGADGSIVAEVENSKPEDVRLILAAPHLLGACMSALYHVEESEMRDVLREVIAKATGEG